MMHRNIGKEIQNRSTYVPTDLVIQRSNDSRCQEMHSLIMFLQGRIKKHLDALFISPTQRSVST